MAVAFQAVFARNAWRRTVRAGLVVQIYLLGVRSIPLICGVGFLVGTLVVAQYESWVGRIIELKYLPTLLVVVVVREIAPLLVNILLIARGGSAMASHLGLMSALGEVRALDAQGMDPLPYLVVPRVIGMLISAVCLVLAFLACTTAGAFACGQWIGARFGSPIDLVRQMLLKMSLVDVIALLVKTCVPAWVGASICCIEGLAVKRDVVVIPRQTALAVQKSLIAVVFISSLVSWVAFF